MPARSILRADQIEAYHRDGFVVPLLPAAGKGYRKAAGADLDI